MEHESWQQILRQYSTLKELADTFDKCPCDSCAVKLEDAEATFGRLVRVYFPELKAAVARE